MIDYRRQQLKEKEREGGGEIQRIKEDRRNSLSQDWQQVLGNLRQKLSGSYSHEDVQRLLLDRQWQQLHGAQERNYEKDQCATKAEQKNRHNEGQRQRMHQSNEISMSQQAQSQQQNAHHPNHLKDQEDQQQEPWLMTLCLLRH